MKLSCFYERKDKPHKPLPTLTKRKEKTVKSTKFEMEKYHHRH